MSPTAFFNSKGISTNILALQGHYIHMMRMEMAFTISMTPMEPVPTIEPQWVKFWGAVRGFRWDSGNG